MTFWEVHLRTSPKGPRKVLIIEANTSGKAALVAINRTYGSHPPKGLLIETSQISRVGEKDAVAHTQKGGASQAD